MNAPLNPEPKLVTQDREDVFTRLVHEHARFLYRVANSLLRHPQDAEDAVQDALLKLYRSESWRGMKDERAFLARVVWRAALDRRTAQGLSVEDGAELRMPDMRPTPERAVACEDERLLLHELIDALPVELRAPLLLSAMEELNSREIGEVMGIPEGTVRTRLMRARSELRRAFEAREYARVPVHIGKVAG
ncbi:MAG TPA: RNA polymerase sigma factor [Acidobacteriaceae bacterium]|jgi:RNA polymerase sigma-70 factor (ECF subfamily)